MTSRRARLAGTTAASAALLLAATPVLAGTKVEATYAATLAGFPVGAGTLTFTAAGAGDWRADVAAQVKGLAQIVANRQATASSNGHVAAKSLVSDAYRLQIDGAAEPNHVDMAFAGPNVKSVEASELHYPGWDRRVPLLPEHKRNVIDPLAAFVVPLAAGQDPMDKANCERTARVFDGRVRYDLRMTYGATMDVQGKGKGYAGPALICAVAYRPIAGFRPLTPEEEKFERNLEFSIWFVPAGEARMLIPYRVVVGTPFGLLQVYAHAFQVKTDTAETVAAGPAATDPQTTGSVPTHE